ncbi:MAG: hypothetical protein ABS888_00070 [Eubacteriales bacterium]
MSAVLNISIDLSSPNLTDQDKAIIAALGLTPGGDWPPAPAPAAVEVDVQVEETVTEDAGEKPAPKPRAARKPRAKKAEEPAETGGPAALEDLPTVTRSEAIEWAIKLSDKGLKDELRQVLDQIGAERASTITDGEQAAQFIALTKSVLAAQPAEEAPAEEAPAEEAPAEEAPAEESPAEEAPAEEAAAPAAGRTLQDAIDAAMALVKDNKGAVVRAAVESLGVPKVSAMTEDQVPEFFHLIDQIKG